MKRIAALVLVAVVLVVWSVIPARGAAGDLKTPGVAISAKVPKAHREMVRKVLRHEDCKFIKGSWLNSFTQLHYKSDTKALNQFLDELSKVPGVKIHVGFYKPGKDALWAPDGSNWSVFHSGIDNGFQVKIRLGSDIDLTQLYLPTVRGPAVDDTVNDDKPRD